MNAGKPSNATPGLVELRLSGLIDEDSVRSLISERDHGVADGVSRWLVHTSTARIQFDSARLAGLVESVAEICPRAHRFRVHVIASDDLNYGCMRMLAAHFADTGISVQVYSDADTARGELLAA